MNLDEFNLVCYASMYSYMQHVLYYISHSQGNFLKNMYINNN